jgi:acetyl-CoA carboxylase biotin carboxylase subunit
MPSPGRVEYLSVPEGPGIRHDSGVCGGYEMGFDYDAMLAKLCVWAPTRPRAVERLRRALGEYDVRGLTTNLEFLKRLVDVPAFIEGRYDTGFIEQHRDILLAPPGSSVAVDEPMAAAALVALLSDGRALSDARLGARAGRAPAPPDEKVPSGPAASAWRDAHRRRRLGM